MPASPTMSWGRGSDTRGTLDYPVPHATPNRIMSVSSVCHGSLRNADFCSLGNVDDQSATFNLKDRFSIILSVSPRSFWLHRTVICCQHVLSHGCALWEKLTATLPCHIGKDGACMQYIMAKGHVLLCNTRVGNTCNPFTLFIVLLSIHRRLWSPYLLSVPCITNTSHYS